MLKRRTHIVLAFVLSAIAAWAQLERAQELARQGKPEAALDALRPLLAQKQEEALLLAGDLWMELERPDSALALYLQIPRAERRPEIVRRIGTAYSLLGKHAEAIRLLRSHYERKPNDLELLLALVQALIAADSSSKPNTSSCARAISSRRMRRSTPCWATSTTGNASTSWRAATTSKP